MNIFSNFQILFINTSVLNLIVPMFLFPNDFAILVEAHTIEQVAAVQLGLRVSHAGLRFDLQRLYHPRTRKGLLRSFQKASALLAVEETLAAAEAVGIERVAIIMTSALVRMQYQRISEGRNVKIFDNREDALAWLRADQVTA